MKISLLLASSIFLTAHTALLAQQASPAGKESPPNPPLMNNAPAECQWTVTYTPKNPVQEDDTPQSVSNRRMRVYNNPTILSKHVMKSGGQTAIFTDYEAGLKTEAWVIAGTVYELPYREGMSAKYDEKKGSDFSEVNWIKAENFRGTVELKGTKVHLYEANDAAPTPAPSPTPGPPPGKVLPRRAYIDATSRLPVVVDLGDTVLTYQYSGPVSSFPTPSDRVKKVMQETTPPKRQR